MTEREESYDLIVLGGGAGGLTAATVAATEGLRVLLIEKSGYIGGTTAISGGMVWVPNNHLMAAAGLSDSVEVAQDYLGATVPEAAARAKLDAYLAAGPEAIRYLCDRTHVKLQPVARYPDYYATLEGATVGGRVLEPVPFDGSRLGKAFAWLRAPLPEFTLFGGMMVARGDIPHFRRFATSARSALRVARLVSEYAVQRLRYPRGTSLVLGNALAARLLYSARAAGVTVRRNTNVSGLLIENGRCAGVRVSDGRSDDRVASTRGVVIATGGFSHDAEFRRHFMPRVAGEISATVDCARGDGLRLAQAVGATLDTDMTDAAFWVPVSRYTAADGRQVVYPHTVTDRSKPGAIAVDTTGRRFVNECVSYHEFVRAMLRSHNAAGMRAYLVCDSRFIWKYGLGAVMPFTWRLEPFVKAGYLRRGGTIADLARALGLEPQTLVATVDRYNTDARNGEDPQFGRGGDAYQRHLGDADHGPNPCVAPLTQAPFYAVELRPGDLGTAAGLATDTEGRVLTETGAPTPGLYAVGNDAASIMRGNYPGPGITLGPALTYGYLAAKAAVAEG